MNKYLLYNLYIFVGNVKNRTRVSHYKLPFFYLIIVNIYIFFMRVIYNE